LIATFWCTSEGSFHFIYATLVHRFRMAVIWSCSLKNWCCLPVLLPRCYPYCFEAQGAHWCWNSYVDLVVSLKSVEDMWLVLFLFFGSFEKSACPIVSGFNLAWSFGVTIESTMTFQCPSEPLNCVL
jgi:hypothetical protein